jgi:type VI secretion system protein ImpC
MSRPTISFGSIQLSAGDKPSAKTSAGRPASDAPLRIVVMGDFSGRLNRSHEGPASLKPAFVDRDNFDETIARFGVRLEGIVASSQGESTSISFSRLDDFTPDELYERVDLFAELRALRRQLSNPATFDEAAQKVRSWGAAVEPGSSQSESTAEPNAPSPFSVEGLFDDALEATQSRSDEQRSRGPLDFAAMIREIAEPYSLPTAPADQAQLIACVDRATGELMRGILHHPYFQSIEAAWRSLFFLVRRLPTDPSLKIYALDVTKRELAAQLGSADDLSETPLYKTLVEETVHTSGAAPWGLLVGNYTFDFGPADAELLGRLAKIAHAAGAPLISGAGSRHFNCESLSATPDPRQWKATPSAEATEAFAALAELPESESLALVAPRLLMRLPYGSSTNPIESFSFDELPDGGRHEEYLWGCGAFACASAIGQGFAQDGWSLDASEFLELDDLPLHVYDDEGQSECYPCAECFLTDRAVDEIRSHRIITLISHRQSDRVRISEIRSYRAGKPALAGRWND